MRVSTGVASALARLAAWDAPFLPVVEDVRRCGDGVEIRCEQGGVPLDGARRWPAAQRRAAAVQLVAAAAFLYERGWYPGRRLLRCARLHRFDGSVRLRLAELPARRLDDPATDRRLRHVAVASPDLQARVLLPLLDGLLPGRRETLRAVLAGRPPWEAPRSLIRELAGRGGGAMRHPGGFGRALWARRFEVPRRGVFRVPEPEVMDGIVAAARLAAVAEGAGEEVAGGPWEEQDVARLQARAVAADRDSTLLTTYAVPGGAAVTMGLRGQAVWVLAWDAEAAHRIAAEAEEAGRRAPYAAREILEQAAAAGFRPDRRSAERGGDRRALSSPSARRVLAWLECAPIGLGVDELEALDEAARPALEELERLGLVHRSGGVARAHGPLREPDPARLEAMAARLPRGSVRALVASAMLGGGRAPLVAWCRDRLEAGEGGPVAEVARALPDDAALAVLGAEAALGRGALAEAERLLDGVEAPRRTAAWHALAAWWAELAGVDGRAEAELAGAAGAGLPARLAARAALVEAEVARRKGDQQRRLAALRRAREVAPGLPDAAIFEAAEAGRRELALLIRARRCRWSGDTRARALHVLGYGLFEEGRLAEAAAAFRVALRAVTGEDLVLLGTVHADLGSCELLLDRWPSAERHLLVAERILERCGSRRAVTVVRANRGVLACDRLDWRLAAELGEHAWRHAEERDDCSAWLCRFEKARADLARGDATGVRRVLPRLEAGSARHLGVGAVRQALAAVRAHLALAEGDLAVACREVGEAEPGERELIAAVGRGERGEEPDPGLPARWGLAITARLLALWRRGREEEARDVLTAGLARSPREAAVGFVRFAAILGRRGEAPDGDWIPLRRRVEAALRSAGLEAWLGQGRAPGAADGVRLVRALDGIVNAGTDAWRESRLVELASALGLAGLEIRRGGCVLGAWGDLDDAALEVGAGAARVRAGGGRDPVVRPVAELLARFASGLAGGDGEDEGADQRAASILGTSEALAAVRREVATWAPLPVTVLITGEPGTGKELVARELHRLSGRRGDFVPVNCAGLPSTLLEAELFGVSRGAFTGADRDRPGLVEAAAGGTLFLDEVGELPRELQAKLLRLLQEKEVRRVGSTASRVVDVRFVAATNRPLATDAESGRLRLDLYYRLATAVIDVPPLRERPADVGVLATHFAARLAREFARPGVTLSPDAVTFLQQLPWPGNVRELEAAVAQAVAAAGPGERLGPDRFPHPGGDGGRAAPLPSWEEAVRRFRRDYLTRLLEECGGNRSEAARRAGITRQALLYHLRKLDLGR